MRTREVIGSAFGTERLYLTTLRWWVSWTPG